MYNIYHLLFNNNNKNLMDNNENVTINSNEYDF